MLCARQLLAVQRFCFQPCVDVSLEGENRLFSIIEAERLLPIMKAMKIQFSDRIAAPMSSRMASGVSLRASSTKSAERSVKSSWVAASLGVNRNPAFWRAIKRSAQ